MKVDALTNTAAATAHDTANVIRRSKMVTSTSQVQGHTNLQIAIKTRFFGVCDVFYQKSLRAKFWHCPTRTSHTSAGSVQEWTRWGGGGSGRVHGTCFLTFFFLSVFGSPIRSQFLESRGRVRAHQILLNEANIIVLYTYWLILEAYYTVSLSLGRFVLEYAISTDLLLCDHDRINAGHTTCPYRREHLIGFFCFTQVPRCHKFGKLEACLTTKISLCAQVMRRM